MSAAAAARQGETRMTTETVLIALSAIAALAVGGLLAIRPRPATARRRPLPEDMFAYSMYDDPC
jgi:hypothetical protein